MDELESDLIDWEVYVRTSMELGPDCVRILGYFREDGVQSVARIEEAMRAGRAAPIVDPANTLKRAAAQFGAMKLSEAAEKIEMTAFKCVEYGDAPDEVLELVAALRPMFEETMAELEQESSPVVNRHEPAEQTRVGGYAASQSR